MLTLLERAILEETVTYVLNLNRYPCPEPIPRKSAAGRVDVSSAAGK
jgi:hypothetical protein